MDDHDRTSSGARWQLCLIGILVAACTTPALETDATYPIGWRKIQGAGPECHGIVGTFANKGVLVDAAGKEREAWLTGLLPFNQAVPLNDTVRARDAMRTCERVSLRVESTPWRAVIGPDAKHWKLIVTAARPSGTQPTAVSDPCSEFRLPEGLGYPLEANSDLLPSCTAGFFATANVGRGLSASNYRKLTVDSEGALIIRLEVGTVTPSHVGWARFQRLP